MLWFYRMAAMMYSNRESSIVYLVNKSLNDILTSNLIPITCLSSSLLTPYRVQLLLAGA